MSKAARGNRIRAWGFAASRAAWAALCAAYAFVGPASAQTPDERTREVHVPYADFEEVLKKDAMGVLLTRVEFDKLRALAAANLRGDGPGRAVLAAATYRATVSGDAVRGTAVLTCEVPGHGVHLLPLALDGVGVIAATLDDGTPALLARDAGGALSLALSGAGRRTITVEFTLALADVPEGKRIAWRIPRAPVATLDLAIPGEQDATIEGAIGESRLDAPTRATGVRVALGGVESFAVRFRPKVDDARREPAILARPRVTLTLAERVAKARWAVDYTVYRTGTDKFRLPLPEGWTLQHVEAPNLLSWEATGGVLEVRLRTPALGKATVIADFERLLADGAVIAPLPAPEGVLRREGQCDVFAAEALHVRPIEETAVRAATLPPARGQPDAPVRTWHFAAGEPRLRLSVARIEARVVAEVRGLIRVDEEEARGLAEIRLKVTQGRLFRADLALPEGTAVTAVTGRSCDVTWTVEGSPARLAVVPAQPVDAGRTLVLEVATRRELVVPAGGETRFPWPLPAPDAVEATGVVGLAHDRALRVGEAGATGVEPVDVRTVAREEEMEDAELAFAWRLTKPTAQVQLTAAEEVPRLTLDTLVYAAWRDENVQVAARLTWDIQAGAVRELRFVLPAGTGPAVDIRGPGITEPARTETPEGDVWRVPLAEKVRDAFTCEVRFSRRHAPGEARAVPLPRGQGVASQTLHVACEAAERIEVAAVPNAMREVDPGELPPWPGYVPTGRLLAAWRAEGPEAAVQVTTTRFDQRDVADAVVLASRVRTLADAARGEQTEVEWIVAESGRQSLAVRIPADAVLLSLTVDGVGVKPVRAGDALVVPLPGRRAAERRIRALYERRESAPGALSVVGLDTPRPADAKVPVLDSSVALTIPSEYRALAAGGSLARRFVLPGRSALRALWEDYRGLSVTAVIGLLAVLVLWAFRESLPALPRFGALPRWVPAATASVLFVGLAWVYLLGPGMLGRLNERSAGARPPADVAMDVAPEQEDPFEEELGVVTADSADLEERELSKSTQDAIGVGGGAGGTFGGRRGGQAPRARRPAPKPMATPTSPTGPSGPGGGPAAPAPAPEMPAESADHPEQDVMPADGDDGQRADAGLAAGEGGAPEVIPGGGGGGGFRPRGQIVDARGGTPLGAYVGGTRAMGGLKALDLPFTPAGIRYDFRGGSAGGDAWVLVASGGLLRFLALVCFAFAAWVPFGTRTRPGGAAAAIPALLLALTLAPELAPGLAPAANAGIAGLICGLAAALVIRWRAPKLPSPRALGAVAVAVAAAAAGVDADAQDKPVEPPPADRRIYVPYDPAKLGQPAAGPRVYLPYAEFLRLFAAAYPDRLPFGGQTSIGGQVRAAYRATLDGQWLTGTVEIAARAVGEGWVEIPLGFAGAQVERALVAGKPAPLRVRPDGSVALLLLAPGEFAITADFRARTTGTPKNGELAFTLGGAPATTLALTLADAALTARVPEARGATTADRTGAKPVVTAHLGAAPRLRIVYEPHAAARAAEGLSVAAETETLCIAADGHQRLRLRASFTVAGGERDAFRFGLDDGVDVLEVTGDNLRGWAVEGAGADRALVVRMNVPVRDKTTLMVSAERRLATPTGPATLPRLEPLGVGRETGTIALAALPHLRASVGDTTGLGRVAAERAGDAGGARVEAAFRFASRPVALAYSTEPADPRPTARVRLDVRVRAALVRCEADLRFGARTRGAVLHRVSALLPPGYVLKDAQGAGLADHWTEPGPAGTTRLWLSMAKGAGELAAKVVLESPLAAGAATIEIPRVRTEGTDRQQGEVLVTADPGLTLASRDLAGLAEDDPRRLGAAADALAYRYLDADYRGALAITRLAPRVAADWLCHTVVQARGADHALYIRFRIEVAPAKELRVRLPAAAEGIEIAADGLREVRTGAAGERILVFQEPMLGEVAVPVFAHVPAAEGVPVPLLQFSLPDVETEREHGHVLLQAGESLATLAPAGIAGLVEIARDKVPDVPSDLPLARISHAYRRERGALAGAVKLTRLETAKGAGIAVDLLEAETALSPEGEARSRVVLHVMNRERQFLPVTLPAGAALYSCFVADQAVHPAAPTGGAAPGALLIPLPRLARGDPAFTVELVYAQSLGAPGAYGSLAPGLPTLPADVTVGRIAWSVRVPEGYTLASHAGNMHPAAAAAEIETLKLKHLLQQQSELLGVARAGKGAEAQRALSNLAVVEQKVAQQWQVANQGQAAASRADVTKEFLDKNERDLQDARREVQSRETERKKLEETVAERQQVDEDYAEGYAQKKSLDEFRKQGQARRAPQQDAEGKEPADPAVNAPRARLAFKGEKAKEDEAEKRANDKDGRQVADRLARLKVRLPEERANAPAQEDFTTTGALVTTADARTLGALSLRVPLPPGGTAHHFQMTGTKAGADLRLRLVRSQSLDFWGAALRLLAPILLFAALRRRKLFGAEGVSPLGQVAFATTLCVAAGAALTSGTVAVAIVVLAGLDLYLGRKRGESTPAW